MVHIDAQVLFRPIDRDINESRELYSDSLGISFKEDAHGDLYTSALPGATSRTAPGAIWILDNVDR